MKGLLLFGLFFALLAWCFDNAVLECVKSVRVDSKDGVLGIGKAGAAILTCQYLIIKSILFGVE